MIRPYRQTDLNRLLDVWYSASLVGHPFLDEAFFDKERTQIRDVHLPRAETWVYEEGDDVVGFIALLGNEVGAIFVDADHQGRGVGRALMDHARRLRGGLELSVFKENEIGRSFYQRYGFKQVAERVDPATGLIELRLRLTG